MATSSSDALTSSVALQSLPVRSLSVTVVEGADVGATAKAVSDRLTIGTASDNDLVLKDPTVSRYHCELWCAQGEIHLLDHGSTNGTVEQKVRIEKGIVGGGAVLKVGHTKLRVDEAEARTIELLAGDALGGMRGKSAAMRRVMATVAKAAQSNAPVLVGGESGTGKELVARAIHEASPRAKKPMVVVDCGTLSPSLVASELFGHEKGAFTGAIDQHVGAFERAHGGTIFLDEIGEVPAALQTNLLGVLERKTLRRLGGRADVAVDVRVVSATNRDLRAEVNAGKFRLDLYYRLAVVRVDLPPLRERPDDIPLLVSHFLTQLGETGRTLPADVLDRLRAHAWPGNVRELRNFVEATLALGEAPPLEGAVAVASGMDALMALPFKDARARFEAEYVKQLLDRAGGNVAQAARDGGVDRTYLHDLIRRYRLRE